MGMPHNPFPYFGVPKVIGRIPRIGNVGTESNAKAPGPAKPSIFPASNQGATLNVTTATIDDVSLANQIPTQSLSICHRDPCDAILQNPVFADVLGHDRGNPCRYIVGCM
jgi:hypothetical protein